MTTAYLEEGGQMCATHVLKPISEATWRALVTHRVSGSVLAVPVIKIARFIIACFVTDAVTAPVFADAEPVRANGATNRTNFNRVSRLVSVTVRNSIRPSIVMTRSVMTAMRTSGADFQL